MLISNTDELDGWQEYRKKPVVVKATQIDCEVEIKTREGILKAYPGDYIIEGIEGEIYPCGEDIFKATYSRVDLSVTSEEEWIIMEEEDYGVVNYLGTMASKEKAKAWVDRNYKDKFISDWYTHEGDVDMYRDMGGAMSIHMYPK